MPTELPVINVTTHTQGGGDPDWNAHREGSFDYGVDAWMYSDPWVYQDVGYYGGGGVDGTNPSPVDVLEGSTTTVPPGGTIALEGLLCAAGVVGIATSWQPAGWPLIGATLEAFAGCTMFANDVGDYFHQNGGSDH